MVSASTSLAWYGGHCCPSPSFAPYEEAVGGEKTATVDTKGK